MLNKTCSKPQLCSQMTLWLTKTLQTQLSLDKHGLNQNSKMTELFTCILLHGTQIILKSWWTEKELSSKLKTDLCRMNGLNWHSLTDLFWTKLILTRMITIFGLAVSAIIPMLPVLRNLFLKIKADMS
jgi:hypothetical protein